MAETTTVEVSLETWRKLNERKERPGESFDEVIDELLAIAESTDDQARERDVAEPVEEHEDDRDQERDVDELLEALEEWEPNREIRRERAVRGARRAVRWLAEQEKPQKRSDFEAALAGESELSTRVWWERAVQPALRFLADRELVEYRPGFHDYLA